MHHCHRRCHDSAGPPKVAPVSNNNRETTRTKHIKKNPNKFVACWLLPVGLLEGAREQVRRLLQVCDLDAIARAGLFGHVVKPHGLETNTQRRQAWKGGGGVRQAWRGGRGGELIVVHALAVRPLTEHCFHKTDHRRPRSFLEVLGCGAGVEKPASRVRPTNPLCRAFTPNP